MHGQEINPKVGEVSGKKYVYLYC